MTDDGVGYSLYDGAWDHIDARTDFSQPNLQVWMTEYNATTPILLRMYERREFLRYFFMGQHRTPALTAKQAMDFKMTFDTTYFPANGLESYNKWLAEDGNTYEDTFLYCPLNFETNELKMNHWQIGYIFGTTANLAEFTEYSKNHNNWFRLVTEEGSAWSDALYELKDDTEFRKTMARMAGLFASGKFLVYFEREVKGKIDSVAKGKADVKFDPYTGNISVGSYMGQPAYNGPFSGLPGSNNDIGRLLLGVYNDPGNSLENPYRLFCLLCQWLGSSYDRTKYPAEYEGKPITSYWDFTPYTGTTDGRPSDISKLKLPSIIRTLNTVSHIRSLTARYLIQTGYLNNDTTSYRNFWDGAQLKLNSTRSIWCPFFFAIGVDFDNTDPNDTPFDGEQLRRMNDAIKKVLSKRKEIADEINRVFQNVAVVKTCNATTITAGNALIYKEGASGNTLLNEATCVYNEGTDEDTKEVVTPKEPVPEEKPIDSTKIVNTFEKAGKTVEPATGSFDGSGGDTPPSCNCPKGDKGDPGKDAEIFNPLTIALLVSVCVIFLMTAGCWIYVSWKTKKYQRLYDENELVP